MATKVFRLNDTDWWAAETLDEAKADYLKMVGGPEREYLDDPRELTDREMEDHQFYPDGVVEEAISFAEELQNRIRDHKGVKFSELFASTEY
jgi:hypothetical protein